MKGAFSGVMVFASPSDVDAHGAVGAPAWWPLLTLMAWAIDLGVSW